MEGTIKAALLLSLTCLILAKPYSAGALVIWKSFEKFEDFLTTYNCTHYKDFGAFLCTLGNVTLFVKDGYIQANAPCTTENSMVLKVLKAPKIINCSTFDACIQSDGKVYLRKTLNSGEIELYLENTQIKDLKIRADFNEVARFLEDVGFKIRLYGCKEVPITAIDANKWLKNFLKNLQEKEYVKGYSLTEPKYALCNVTIDEMKPKRTQEASTRINTDWILIAALPATALIYFSYRELTNFRGRRKYKF